MESVKRLGLTKEQQKFVQEHERMHQFFQDRAARQLRDEEERIAAWNRAFDCEFNRVFGRRT